MRHTSVMGSPASSSSPLTHRRQLESPGNARVIYPLGEYGRMVHPDGVYALTGSLKSRWHIRNNGIHNTLARQPYIST